MLLKMGISLQSCSSAELQGQQAPNLDSFPGFENVPPLLFASHETLVLDEKCMCSCISELMNTMYCI